MSDKIELIIKGTPRARPRALHTARIGKNGKAYATSYQPTKVTISRKTGKPTPESLRWARAQEWYSIVRWALHDVRPAEPWTGPVSMTIDVFFERPEKLNKKNVFDGPIRHVGPPDRDNLEKSITDALKEAGLYVDDCQVCAGEVRKWYAAKGGGPGVIVVAERIGMTEESIFEPEAKP